MNRLMNVNYAVESFIGDNCTNYVLRVMMDPRQAPIVLGVFPDVDGVAHCIAKFNEELSANTEHSKS